MTEEAKRCVDALRTSCEENGSCPDCPVEFWCHSKNGVSLEDAAADLIESLSTQLEQVTRERDEYLAEHDLLDAQVTALDGALYAMTRERDAAVRDFTEAMKYSESCIFCKHLDVTDDEGGCDMPKLMPGESCWQWRGVEG